MKVVFPFRMVELFCKSIKLVVCLCLIIFSVNLCAQPAKTQQALPAPRYDTSQIEVRSYNSFWFCSRLFPITDVCDSSNSFRNCSYYTNRLSPYHNIKNSGQLVCSGNISFAWFEAESEEKAKQDFEWRSEAQNQKQKSYREENIDFYILDKKAPAYKQHTTSQSNLSSVTIHFYATINGHHIYGMINMLKDIKTSRDLPADLQQLIRF